MTKESEVNEIIAKVKNESIKYYENFRGVEIKKLNLITSYYVKDDIVLKSKKERISFVNSYLSRHPYINAIIGKYVKDRADRMSEIEVYAKLLPFSKKFKVVFKVVSSRSERSIYAEQKYFAKIYTPIQFAEFLRNDM
jgi:hypothetical protein